MNAYYLRTLQPYFTTSPALKDKNEERPGPGDDFRSGDTNLPPAGRPGCPQTAASVSKMISFKPFSGSLFIPVLS